MKKLIILPILLLLSFLSAFYLTDANAQTVTTATKRTLAAPACSGFYGTFTASNWPGGKLQVTCPGKNRQRGKCVGNSAKLSPGEGFSFNNCNCLDPKGKCLTVSNLPPDCKLTKNLACASNRETVESSFHIECTKPLPPCAPSPSDAPSDLSGIPSDVPALSDIPSPSGMISDNAVPSPVCLGLGSIGGCLSPTPPPCRPVVPSDMPSIAIPSINVPSSINVPPVNVTIPPVNIPPVNVPGGSTITVP